MFHKTERALQRPLQSLSVEIISQLALRSQLYSYLIYLSIGTAFQLNVEPPPEFLRGESDWGPKRRAAEEQMARAYWRCSVEVIGSRYGFGQNLPAAAPAEFRIDERRLAALSPKAAEDASARYWQKLRQVWVLPQVWEKHYQWSTSWFGKSLLGHA